MGAISTHFISYTIAFLSCCHSQLGPGGQMSYYLLTLFLSINFREPKISRSSLKLRPWYSYLQENEDDGFCDNHLLLPNCYDILIMHFLFFWQCWCLNSHWSSNLWGKNSTTWVMPLTLVFICFSGVTSDHDTSTSASYITGIVGVYFHTWLSFCPLLLKVS
jgi:hypothetical protein